MSYKPQPIDTSKVEIDGDMQLLLERLASNTHEVWAAGRLQEGWTYGPERDDQLKTHPCLVPYEQLPESEKEYDRQTSVQTLKAIIKLGYRIIRD